MTPAQFEQQCRALAAASAGLPAPWAWAEPRPGCEDAIWRCTGFNSGSARKKKDLSAAPLASHKLLENRTIL